MIAKQIKFRCPYSDTIERTKERLGGIAIYSDDTAKEPEYVICGCCGGIYRPDEIVILRKYDWLPISEEIIGE